MIKNISKQIKWIFCSNKNSQNSAKVSCWLKEHNWLFLLNVSGKQNVISLIL